MRHPAVPPCGTADRMDAARPSSFRQARTSRMRASASVSA
ncbi:hypothetical protein DB32_001826 [Sandaracinus amylolyticus]|uniref:Uncharacterized protein n=1 Tax=Sandaracinus amylolyticus TaxID=927083 RepID=A0A0F6W171_9BACT|nr:hypothetical protein DB32_001826 [Sandaracinus amylolyticus]